MLMRVHFLSLIILVSHFFCDGAFAISVKRKMRKLNEARAILKLEFQGINPQINEMIDSVSGWYLYPQAQRRPTIINVWGWTGTGKTSLIRRLMELLDISKIAQELDMGSVASTDMSELGILGSGIDIHRFPPHQPAVLMLDEFHMAHTLDDHGNEVQPVRQDVRQIFQIMGDGIWVEALRHQKSRWKNYKFDRLFHDELPPSHPDKAAELRELTKFLGLDFEEVRRGSLVNRECGDLAYWG